MAVVMAKAIYDFTGDPAVRQLSFKKGAVIKVTHQYENGWWAGEINGKIGYLPSTYITLVEGGASAPKPGPKPAPAGGAKPAPGGGAKPQPPVPGGGRPSPGVPTENKSGFSMQAVTSSGGAVPVQVNKPPPARNPPPAKPSPAESSQPAPTRTPPPVAGKPPPSAKPSPVPQKPAQTPAASPGLGKSAGWASAATPGSEANEADFNELDSLIKSLQDEVLDLKKLL